MLKCLFHIVQAKTKDTSVINILDEDDSEGDVFEDFTNKAGKRNTGKSASQATKLASKASSSTARPTKALPKGPISHKGRSATSKSQASVPDPRSGKAGTTASRKRKAPTDEDDDDSSEEDDEPVEEKGRQNAVFYKFFDHLGDNLYCRGQVVTPASQDSTAVVEGTSTSDVLLLLKTGLRYVPKWKTEG
jgi:hypothetical protein